MQTVVQVPVVPLRTCSATEVTPVGETVEACSVTVPLTTAFAAGLVTVTVPSALSIVIGTVAEAGVAPPYVSRATARTT